MFDWIVSALSGAWWVYPLIAFLAVFDVIVPILPSETAVITGGIIAGSGGGLLVPLVLVSGAVGAFGGDNLAHWIGRRWAHLARRYLLRGERGERAIAWADRQLRAHGSSLIVIGRFLPGGRTAMAVGSGVLNYPWRRFAVFDAIGAITWATVTSMIGYLGGRHFRHDTLLAFALSFGVALAVAVLIELGRWLVERRRQRGGAGAPPPQPPRRRPADAARRRS